MNRKVVDEIKDYFESYELMDKLTSDSKEDPAVKVNIYFNERKQVLSVKVIEIISREKSIRRSMGLNINDNMFCEFRLNYSKAKFSFKLNTDKIKLFHEKVKPIIQKKYKCSVVGTTVFVELYDPKLQEIMNIFIEFEPICRRIK